ncbi:MAG: VOC family protein [Nocardioidaceae bacterium]
MSSRLNPYLSFRGNAREAMQFYQSVFGGELTVSTFADVPGMPGVEASEANKVMHSTLETPDGLTLMGADTPTHMDYSAPAGMSVSLSGDHEATLRGYWDGLADGATVGVPLEKAPWGDTFGMLTDKFGTPWLVNIAGQPT